MRFLVFFGVAILIGKTRAYSLPTEVEAKLWRTLGETCCEGRTYLELIRVVSSNFSERVFLKGGLVRDLVRTHDTTGFLDVDIGFTGRFDAVVARLSAAGVRHLSMSDFNFLTVGPMNGPHLDGTGLYGQGPTGYDLADVETPANALMLQLFAEKTVLIDLLDGQGVEDARALVWRAPHPPGTPAFRRWVEEHDKPATASHRLLWRMIKFKLRNFTVPDATAAAIYTYWLSRKDVDDPQWEKVWTLLSDVRAAEVGLVVAADMRRLRLDYTFEDFVRTLVARRALYRLSLGRALGAASPACPPGVNRYAGVCLVPASIPSRRFLALGVPAFCCAREDEL